MPVAGLKREERPQRAAAHGDIAPVPTHVRHTNSLVVGAGSTTVCGAEHGGERALADKTGSR